MVNLTEIRFVYVFISDIKHSLTVALISLSLYAVPTVAYEKVLSVGVQSHDASWETGDSEFDNQDFSDSSLILGARLYNEVGAKHLFGLGIDYDKILSDKLIGYRALDYQYKWGDNIRLGGFFGAASISTGLPQNGYYYGINGSVFVYPKSLALRYELRVGDGLARDRLDDDPDGERPDVFLDFVSHTLSASWHF